MSKLLELSNRFYDRLRSAEATRAAEGPAASGGFDHLRGHKYALVVTFRRDASAVPTPVWFGLDGEGMLYFRTGRDVAKVRRIRRDSRVLVAPCTLRGKPLGPSVEGRAATVDPADRARAEQAIQSNYGLGRRLYEGAGDRMGIAEETVYVQVAPAETG